MEISTNTQSDFFGKDNLTTFLGVVEDVKDPKGAGRVRVRCVGWHPKDKNDLPTDELPWSRVSAPTTHAQQGRVGSKHGLLPGCWVWGFFLDGNDAQNAMVCGSFPFTAGVSDRDLRTDTEGQESSTQDNSIPAFDKVKLPQANNDTVNTKDEKSQKGTSTASDPSGDAPALEDSTDKVCGERKSAAKEARDAEYSVTNVAGQKCDVYVADGGCGNIPHTQSDIQKKMQEKMVSLHNRMVAGDAVWDAYSGAYINLNGVMNQLSMDLCGLLKMLLTQQKGFIEETINRPARAVQLLAGTSRDSTVNLIQDDALTIKDDMFHAMMAMFFDQLCGMLMDMIRAMDQSSNVDNERGDGVGKGPGLRDPGADCVAEAVVYNVMSLTTEALNKALQDSDSAIASLGLKPNTNPNLPSFVDVSLTDPDNNGWGDYDPQEIRNRVNEMTAVASAVESTQQSVASSANSNAEDDFMSQFGNILSQLGSVSSLLAFSTNNKFSLLGSRAHNRSGNQSQDKRTKDGSCQMERLYNTSTGLQGGMAAALGSFGNISGAISGLAGGGSGIASGAGGAGTGRGSFGDGTNNGASNNTQLNKIRNIGPGGLSMGKSLTYTTQSCASGELEVVKDCGITREVIKVWKQTQFCVGRNVGILRGEITIGDKRTRRDRVLLRDQVNKTENGIWRTDNKEWVRENDANRSNFFTKGKLVLDCDKVYEYVGINNPALDQDEITFQLYIEPERTTKSYPSGKHATALATGLPSGEPTAARNYVRGVPNTIIITNPGTRYYCPGENPFPSIYIPGYNGTPVPCVDPDSGEIVAINTIPSAWDPSRPNVPISIIPDSSSIGIRTDDENYDVELGGIAVLNTGRGYTNPTAEITNACTGERIKVNLKVVEGRIVGVSEINNPGVCSKAPKITVTDATGYGAKLYPIMNTIPRPNSIARDLPVEMIFCPGKNQKNLI